MPSSVCMISGATPRIVHITATSTAPFDASSTLRQPEVANAQWIGALQQSLFRRLEGPILCGERLLEQGALLRLQLP
jgi:hypothetical protein